MTKQTRFLYSMLLMTGMAVILLYCFSGGISGNDFWWHVKTGEWILTNGAVPRKDIFSWYGMAHEFEWVAHEWLAEVLLWRLYQSFGEIGIFVFSLCAAMLMAGLLALQIREYLMENCLVSCLYLCMFAVVSSLFFYGRPQVFAFFLLYGELYCLDRYRREKGKKCIWLIPGIACLWANLHGGSASLSYFLVLVMLAGGVREWQIGRIQGTKWTGSQCRQLILVLVLTVGAVFLNPAGVDGFCYPYVNMADPVAMNLISEWAPPDAKVTGQLVSYFLPIFLLCFGIFWGGRKVQAQDALYMLLFLFLFFRSARFIIWFYIASAFWAFPYMLPCRLKEVRRKGEVAAVLCLELMLVGVGIGAAGRSLHTCKEGGLLSGRLEESMLEAIREDAPERLFNDYNTGGALIFAGLPVFVDERADLYAEDGILADAASLLLMQQANPSAGTVIFNPEALIEKYEFDAFLVDVSRPLYSYLHSHEERYEEVFKAGGEAYFRRRDR